MDKGISVWTSDSKSLTKPLGLDVTRAIQFIKHKKVLLRERKRHTACRVASTPYVVLTGYPPLARVPPSQGTPLARVLPCQGTPPGWTWQGTPPAAPWHSGKCCKALWDMGTLRPPPVDRQIDGQTRVKTLPSRHTTYAGGKHSICVRYHYQWKLASALPRPKTVTRRVTKLHEVKKRHLWLQDNFHGHKLF